MSSKKIAYCKWCGTTSPKYLVRNGPTEYLFCNEVCVNQYVKFKHTPHVRRVLDADRSERQKILNGMCINEYVTKAVVAELQS